MNINLQQKEDKVILEVSLQFRGKRGKTKAFTVSDAINWITQNNPEIKLGNIISAPSKPIDNVDRLTGVWTFELQKEKPVDIPKKSVIIDEPKIEAEPPIVEEPKEEASLSSEPLPYGLKSTRTRKKKKTKKETTEE